ncbi:MAG TPA: phosphotransferase family protein [Novosphingobium sp.]|nr:phosphotransferase family protein [Novosphingobium sp.]
MSVNALDPSAIRAPLLGWLRAKMDPRLDLLSLEACGDGASSETWFIATRTPGAPLRKWVVRIEASRHQVYKDPSVERQARVMETIARVSDVPVPQVFAFEPDAGVLGMPFFVMEHVEGEVPPQALHQKGALFDAAPAAREAMWLRGIEAMARIHRIGAGPFAFLAPDTPGATPLRRELAQWDAYREWSGVPSYDVFAAARRWLGDNLPQDQSAGLAWGDARLGNIMFRDSACVAVLDWETANLAGAESDLAWWLVFDETVTRPPGMPPLEGIGTRDETIAVWEQHLGRKAKALEWHEIFAAWRIAMIVERAVALADGGAVISRASEGNRAITFLRERVG